MNKTTPRTDPVYSKAKPWEKADIISLKEHIGTLIDSTKRLINFQSGGMVGPKGGEFIENPKFKEPKEGELTLHYYQGTERALILKSPICVNCGKHKNLHEAPYFKCP